MRPAAQAGKPGCSQVRAIDDDGTDALEGWLGFGSDNIVLRAFGPNRAAQGGDVRVIVKADKLRAFLDELAPEKDGPGEDVDETPETDEERYLRILELDKVALFTAARAILDPSGLNRVNAEELALIAGLIAKV